jgi:hypothetical protein
MAMHEQSTGATDEWFTPPSVFNALGCEFDMDVASPGQTTTPWIPAKAFITENGLSVPWTGFIWMNAPFGGRNGLIPWLERFFAHGNGIALVPDRTSAPWWQAAASKAELILFIDGKLKFIDAKGVPGAAPAQGTCLFAVGQQGCEALRRAAGEGLGRLMSSPPAEEAVMAAEKPSPKPSEKPDLKVVSESPKEELDEDKVDSKGIGEELDEDELEFRKLRLDLPGVKGASAIGIVSINVSRVPPKHEFFRVHPTFSSVVPMVGIEEGMEDHFFVVSDEMVKALAGIGISVSPHRLYLTVTSRGAVHLIPIQSNSDNTYTTTKEIGLIAGMSKWVRLYTDLENKCYKVFEAPADRFAEAIWPELKDAKIFRLAFRDKGRLVDSTTHPLFLKWAARDRSK